MRKKILKIVLHILGVVLFVFSTAYALLAAYGYQIDLLHQNIVKTSIIDVANEFEDIEIYFDDRLVAKKAPYQIKKVKPGIHKLDIYKDDYTKWSKKVSVIEDLVTIVDDILLIPFDLEPYLVKIELDFEFDEILINNEYYIFINHSENKIIVTKFNGKNINKINSINIATNNLEVKFIDSSRIGIFDNDAITVIDLRDSSTTNILIPDEFDNFKIAFNPELTGYYLNEGKIYSVNINSDGTFNEIDLLETDKICNKFNVISSYDKVFIKCDELLYAENFQELDLIDKNVYSIPIISPNNAYIVYMNGVGEITTYNVYTQEKELLGRFMHRIDNIYWFEDSKHLLIDKNNTLQVCDLDFYNCHTLFEFEDNFIVNSKISQFIYLDKENLSIYNLSEIN